MNSFEDFPASSNSMAEVDAATDLAAPGPEYVPPALRMSASAARAAIRGTGMAPFPRRRVERPAAIAASDYVLPVFENFEYDAANQPPTKADDLGRYSDDNRHVIYEEDGYDR